MKFSFACISLVLTPVAINAVQFFGPQAITIATCPATCTLLDGYEVVKGVTATANSERACADGDLSLIHI